MRVLRGRVDHESRRIRSLAVTMIFLLWLCGIVSFCAGFVVADYLSQHSVVHPAPVNTGK